MQCYVATHVILSYFDPTDSCLPAYAEFRLWPAPPIGVYLIFLFFTILLESPFFLFVLRRAPRKRAIGWIIAVNLITHPFVVYIWPRLCEMQHLRYREALIIGEIWVPIVEALILSRVFQQPLLRTLSISILANFVSWFLLSLYGTV